MVYQLLGLPARPFATREHSVTSEAAVGFGDIQGIRPFFCQVSLSLEHFGNIRKSAIRFHISKWGICDSDTEAELCDVYKMELGFDEKIETAVNELTGTFIEQREVAA